MAPKTRGKPRQGPKKAVKRTPRGGPPAMTEAQIRALPKPKSNYASLVRAARAAQAAKGKVRAAFAARIK